MAQRSQNKFPRSGNMLVVFDLDHTLTRSDTYVAFLMRVLRARPQKLMRSWRLVVAVALHKLGIRDNTWLKCLFLRTICGGCEREFIESIAANLADSVVANKIKPGAATSLRAHQARGDRVALATASLDIYVAAIANRLNIAPLDVLSTRTEWCGDRLTGSLSSPNLYGQAKADAVAAWVRGLGRNRVDVAYSDHHSDLPLLRGAVRGVAVNPTPQLRAVTRENNFEVVDWEVSECDNFGDAHKRTES